MTDSEKFMKTDGWIECDAGEPVRSWATYAVYVSEDGELLKEFGIPMKWNDSLGFNAMKPGVDDNTKRTFLIIDTHEKHWKKEFVEEQWRHSEQDYVKIRVCRGHKYIRYTCRQLSEHRGQAANNN